jgi:hypothetical protein
MALGGQREETEAIAVVFSRMTANQPLTVEWRALEAAAFDLGTVVLEHARSADLIIAAQADPDWAFSRLLDFPERLAIASGRPVLVIRAPSRRAAGHSGAQGSSCSPSA